MTQIEWTKRPGTIGESWNFLAGCSKVSDGCTNCYALSMSWRIQNMGKRPERYEGVVAIPILRGRYTKAHRQPQWTGRVNLDYDALEIPYRWKKPRTVFVCSMADLFHEKVPGEFITKAFITMSENRRHTFLVLTKRAKRMQRWVGGWCRDYMMPPNLWLGVTAENQEQADKRIPLLLQTPAAVRWVSAEPMLGAINLTDQRNIWKAWNDEWLDWVVIGGESGPNARPMEGQWAKDLIAQCDDAQVPVFVKQLSQHGFHYKVGRKIIKDLSQWQPELQRREWPR